MFTKKKIWRTFWHALPLGIRTYPQRPQYPTGYPYPGHNWPPSPWSTR